MLKLRTVFAASFAHQTVSIAGNICWITVLWRLLLNLTKPEHQTRMSASTSQLELSEPLIVTAGTYGKYW